MQGAQPEALAREPLLGDDDMWNDWFAAAGLRTNVRTVAVFNDAGLMLQAAEQNLGLALSRDLLAADALREGRLVRLSPISIMPADALPYHLVYPPGMREWPALAAFRDWLSDELDRSRDELQSAEVRPAPAASAKRTSRSAKLATDANPAAGQGNAGRRGAERQRRRNRNA